MRQSSSLQILTRTVILICYVAGKGGNMLFRNNGDGTFTENAAAMNLTGDNKGTLSMDFGDWDDDGDLDIFMAQRKMAASDCINNNRHSNFNDISKTVGLDNPKYTGTAIALGDYNNDGTLDILIAGGPGGKCFLIKK